MLQEELLPDEAPRRETKTRSQSLDFRPDLAGLPDLTPLLQQQGVYGEYVAWRDSYMRWRKGEARGARGENTTEDHERRSAEAQRWYPTLKTYSFRRTINFWASVTCIEGCLLFLWIDLISTYTIGGPDMLYEMTKVPNLLGGMFFVAGIYLAWFELINIDPEKLSDGKINYVWVNIEVVTSQGIEPASYIASLLYLIGAAFYTVSQVADFGEWDPIWQGYLIDWPLIIGGFLFFLAGCCELKINNVFTSYPTAYVWWVSVLNWYGGLTFWVSACPSVFPGQSGVNLGASGCVTYTLAAVLALVMWRGEQFGGALIPALNRVAQGAVKLIPNSNGTLVLEVDDKSKSQAKESMNPRLSVRGLIFVLVYICIGAFQVIACCSCLHHQRDYRIDPVTFRRFLNVFVQGCINIVIVHMVLVMNSVNVTMPKHGDEPYRALTILMRIISIVAFANSVLELKVQLEVDQY